MFRRTNGRPPPLLLGGLILFILILSYSYWSLNLQLNDTLRSLESMQASLKIGEVKREQNEKKMSALQDTLHDKEDAILQNKNKLTQQEQDLQEFNNDILKRDQEINSLNQNIQKMQAKMITYEDNIRNLESDYERKNSELNSMIQQRDETVASLDERTAQLNAAEQKIQKLEALQKECLAGQSSAGKGANVPASDLHTNTASGAAASQSKPAIVAADAPSINVAPKPLSGGNTDSDPNAGEANQNLQGVLQQPLKPEEVPVVGDAAHSDHLQAPPLNANAAVVAEGFGVQPQKLVVAVPPIAGKKTPSTKKLITPSSFNKKPAPIAGFIKSEHLPESAILKPNSNLVKSFNDGGRIPVNEPAFIKKKMYRMGNGEDKNTMMLQNPSPLQQPVLLNNQAHNIFNPQYPVVHNAQRQISLQNSVMDAPHYVSNHQPQLADLLQPPNVPHKIHGHIVEQQPSLDLNNFQHRADYNELQEAMNLLGKQNRGSYRAKKSALAGQKNKVAEKDLPDHFIGGELGRNVIQPPDFENLDAAIDEGNQIAEDPLMPDQDPEGDVEGDKEPMDDRLHENRVHEDPKDNQYDYDPDQDDTGLKYRKEGLLLNGENNDWDKKHPDNNGGEIDADDGKEEEEAGDENANEGDFAKENFIDDETGQGAAPLKLNKMNNNHLLKEKNFAALNNNLDTRVVL